MEFACADLEKTFYRVPGDVVWQDLWRFGVEQLFVEFVHQMYRDALVRVNGSFSDNFLVQLGLHEGSVLTL